MDLDLSGLSDMMISLNDGVSKRESLALDFFESCAGLDSDVGCCFPGRGQGGL